MRASEKGKETLLIYIGLNRAHFFVEKKKGSKIWKGYLYEGNRYDKIEIQLW